MTANNVPIIMECTSEYSGGAIGKCGIQASEGKRGAGAPTRFGVIRGANLNYRVAMCARHPVAYGHTGNVPNAFTPYRGKSVPAN